MVTALLIVIYIAFIGLGLPHSLFGAAWPAIQTDMGLSLDSANYITVIISGSTVISSMLGARLTNKYGTAKVVMFATIVAALALFGFSVSPNLIIMCLFSLPLGLASGATDAALNNYISLHYSASHMNFLHCFYGVGIMASPYIMSVILNNGGWRTGYKVIFSIQSVIALIIIVSLPLWKKMRDTEIEEDVNSENLPYLKMFKMADVRLMWIMCIAANAIEGVGGLWGSTFLVYAHNFTKSKAAEIITLFYIGIALGRFLSGIMANKFESKTLIKSGVLVMTLGVILLFINNYICIVLGIFLLGFGNGPVHPNLLYITPSYFGKKISSSVVCSEMAAAYFGITLAPPIFGFLAAKAGAGIFPLYITVWIVVFILSSYGFLKLKKQN